KKYSESACVKEESPGYGFLSSCASALWVTSSNARESSLAEAKRSPGDLETARAMTPFHGLSINNRAGSSRTAFQTTSRDLRSRMGLIISASRTPAEKTSDLVSKAPPSTCSGAI